MTPWSWLLRQARWKRVTILMLVAYVLGVSLNLLLRAALHGWQWYPDLLESSLIFGLLFPVLLLATAKPKGQRR